MGLYSQQNTPASGLTSLNKFLLAHVDHDFLIYLPMLYQCPPCPSDPVLNVDDDICLYLMLKYIDPAVAEVREVLEMRPDSEKPALLVAFVLFSTIAKLAKGARILQDRSEATQRNADCAAADQAAEQGALNKGNDIGALSDLSIDPLMADRLNKSKDLDTDIYGPESSEQSGFCLKKRLEPKRGCQADSLRSSVATHFHVTSTSPAQEFDTRCYQAISNGVEGALRNSELGYHGPVMVSFGDHLGLHLVKIQEVRTNRDKKRWLGPLAPSDRVFEAWKKEKLVEKASSAGVWLEEDEERQGEDSVEEQSSGGETWSGKDMRKEGEWGIRTLSEVPDSIPQRRKRQRSSLLSNPGSTVGLPNIQFPDRPPPEERRLFEITSLGFFSTWTPCGDPVRSIIGLLKHLCYQNCPEAITGGLLGAKKCLDTFEEEERRRAAKRVRPFVGSLERIDLLQCEDVDAMCELLIKEAMEEASSKKI